MTGKRFTVDSDGKWWDKIKHEYVTLDSLFRTVEDLDKKLESKQYTINEMAKTIRIYDDGYIDLNKKCKKLAEENEQLKQSYKEFEDECQSTFNAMNRKQNDLYRKNFKLKEENEQLKQTYIQLKHRHSLLHDECLDVECERGSLKKDVESLEKENEQLKQEKQLLYENIDLLKRFIENQGFKVKLDDKLFRVI